MKKTAKLNDITHISFEFGLLMKGIDGILEIIGGGLLLFLSPSRLDKLVFMLTQHELSKDPKDRIANSILMISHSFSISTQYFGMFYLMSHGIIKCILVYLLWCKKLWAYPLTVFSLVLFIIYQIYRFIVSPSVILILLTVFDLIMIVLTLAEYRNVKIQLGSKID